jgi:hypothetical protein
MWRGSRATPLTGSLSPPSYRRDSTHTPPGLASALWDDTWTDFGGSAELIEALQRDPIANARQVQPDQDALPAGVTRE